MVEVNQAGTAEQVRPQLTQHRKQVIGAVETGNQLLQLPLGQALAGSKNCTESSNSSRSATQSEV